jgi:hypothetical protein
MERFCFFSSTRSPRVIRNCWLAWPTVRFGNAHVDLPHVVCVLISSCLDDRGGRPTTRLFGMTRPVVPCVDPLWSFKLEAAKLASHCAYVFPHQAMVIELASLCMRHTYASKGGVLAATESIAQHPSLSSLSDRIYIYLETRSTAFAVCPLKY